MAGEQDQIVAAVTSSMEILDDVIGKILLLDLRVSDASLAVMDSLKGHPLYLEQHNHIHSIHPLLKQARQRVHTVKVFQSAYLRAVRS